jgi:transcriptional regulator with XRE-family HTH domain
MTELIQGFGIAVRQFRETHGWSQEALAERADLNRSYLGEVERGRVIPSLATAQKLALALGIPLSQLLAHCEQRAA